MNELFMEPSALKPMMKKFTTVCRNAPWYKGKMEYEKGEMFATIHTNITDATMEALMHSGLPERMTDPWWIRFLPEDKPLKYTLCLDEYRVLSTIHAPGGGYIIEPKGFAVSIVEMLIDLMLYLDNKKIEFPESILDTIITETGQGHRHKTIHGQSPLSFCNDLHTLLVEVCDYFTTDDYVDLEMNVAIAKLFTHVYYYFINLGVSLEEVFDICFIYRKNRTARCVRNVEAKRQKQNEVKK